MLSKSHRFRGQGGIRYVYRKGKTKHSAHAVFRFVPTHQQEARVSVVVSKKIAKLAVVRNKIRRRYYEAIRVSGVLTTNSLQSVIIVKDTWAADCEFSELVEEVRRLYT